MLVYPTWQGRWQPCSKDDFILADLFTKQFVHIFKKAFQKEIHFYPNPLASLLLKDVLGRSSMTMVYIFSTLNINLVQRKMKKQNLEIRI